MRPEDYRAFLEEYNRKSAAELLPLWARNAVANAETVRRGRDVTDLRRKALDLPAILVASGPSLNLNIDLLKACQNKAVIIACDSAYRPLLEAGCVPHVVVSLDAKQKNVRFFDGTVSYQKHTKFVCASVVHNDVLRSWLYPPYFYHPDANADFLACLKELVGPRSYMAVGGHVLSSAFVLAFDVLMCDPLIFVGADYCWYGDQHHVAGANVDRFSEDVQPTSDCYGRRAYASYSLRVYELWMRTVLEGGLIREEDGRVLTLFNCTEGGRLSCSGVNNAPLRYVLDEFLSTDLGDISDRLSRGQ